MPNLLKVFICFISIMANCNDTFGSVMNSDRRLSQRSSQPCVISAPVTKLAVGETVTFTSPNYPNEYDPSSDCGWKFKTDKGSVLVLTCDDFSLRPQTKKGECKDFFKVNDFRIASFTKHCGDDNPSGFVTVGRQLNLLFESGKKKLSTGFSCSVTAKDPEPAEVTDCDLDLTVTGGMDEVWSTPNYPGGYPEGITCTLTVTISADPPMALATVTFDEPSSILESHGCSIDNLVYIDSAGMTKRSCGNLVPDSWSETTFYDGPKTFSFTFTSSAADGGNDKGFSLRIKGYDLTG